MTTTAARPGPAPRPSPESRKSAVKAEKPRETFRDFVEQIVVAVILAILIRGFDAEAFVIPTGSMAPTLMGRHKEVTCPECGQVYTVNSSEELENYLRGNPQARAREQAICVNCRWAAPVGEAPSFKGDRILVMKFPYEVPFLPGSGGPHRWDVVVFHYPEHPEQNYIKRLVGMPSEELKILHGDIFTRCLGSDDVFVIARKPLARMKAMAILVNDDNHRARLLEDHPEWRRWKGQGWADEKGSTFAFAGGSKDAKASLRYRHLVPDPEQWLQLARNLPLKRPAKPTLITDFYSYNASTLGDPSDPTAAWRQTDWVGDLLLEFDLAIDKVDGGTITIELVEAGVTNRCVIDPKDGTAVLYHGDEKLGEAKTRIVGAGSHSVGFSNVDDRLTLWVDGRAPFGDGLPYTEPADSKHAPTAADLDPVGITAWGVSARVSGLVLKRDIYYTQDPRRPDCSIESPALFEPAGRDREMSRVLGLFDVLSDPAKFGPLMASDGRGDVYPIRPDNFLMMGDNSPRSSDSRAWGKGDHDWDPDRSRWEVPRHLLIGRAFFVYWPHGVPFGPKIQLSPDFRVPFRPYVERMKPIR